MLTTTTRQIFELSNEKGSFIAHIIRIPVEPEGNYTYVTGLSFSTGQGIGLVTAHSGGPLRNWKRVSAIEEYLMVLGGKLAAIMLYPANNPEQAMIDRLIGLYQLDQQLPDQVLDAARMTLLGALRTVRSSIDGRTPNPSDA